MRRPVSVQTLALVALITTSVLVIIAGALWASSSLSTLRGKASTSTQSADTAIAGFPMKGSLAPDFKLVDQFGKPFSLSSLRGKEVVLAFIDSRCTSLCPLTAEVMYDAKARLGTSVASSVLLVAVNANPNATSIAQVQSWSINHGMLHQWLFVTGTAQQLQAVYTQYQIYDQVGSDGQIIHDPAILIIDKQGHERLYYETLDSNNQSDLNDEITGLEAGMKQYL